MTHFAKAFAAATGALSVIAASGFAQTTPAGPGQGGGMSPPRVLADVSAWADRIFNRLDADQDEAVTGQELAILSSGPAAGMGAGRLRRMIAQSDSSNDGRISREELTVGAERMFRRMDADGDGVLSADERPRPPISQRPVTPVPTPEPEPMPFPDMD